MTELRDIFRSLRERLFGASGTDSKALSSQVPESTVGGGESRKPATPDSFFRPARDPYFVQIGLDFGTAFSKCICRDIIVDKAWIHIPEQLRGKALPFLIPSRVVLENGILSHSTEIDEDSVSSGLPHIKLALEKLGNNQWEDPVLEPFRLSMQRNDLGSTNAELSEMVFRCAVYLLGSILSEVRRDVQSRLSGFGALVDDYTAINMAIPVADAENQGVRKLFQEILCVSWVLSEKMDNITDISWEEFLVLTEAARPEAATESVAEACFIYPEVSANVQGFVRSRTSQEGLYLFSDTGAGTVDQSAFLFIRKDGVDHLIYLNAAVIPWGSSKIEYLAALRSHEPDFTELDRLRMLKESNVPDPGLDYARELIAKKVSAASYSCLGMAKRKLFQPKQFNSLKLIFGGGGDCDNPYRFSVRSQFDGGLFRREAIERRRLRRDPFEIGMPVPSDLELSRDQRGWVRRLSVAYGLSFMKVDLASFTYPSDLSNPEPKELRRSRGGAVPSVSKDVC